MTDPSLVARVERLERMVEELHARVVADPAAPASPPLTEPPRPAVPAAAPAAAPAGPPDGAPARDHVAGNPLAAWRQWLWNSELWLNKLGIGLVLFGVTFLFKYSIDQGWLTPEVRVGFGMLVGVAMLGAGLRLGGRQRSLAQVLTGGGIAVFYIVGFAAFQLYALVGYAVAFAFMVAVTATAFYLAVRADQSVLSLIGVKGALGTPFLLYSGAGNFPWLIGYTCLVVAAAVGLYVLRGWRTVLWTAFAGGWAVLGVAYSINIASLPADARGDRWILQAAVLVFWALFAVVPAWWEARRGRAARTAPGQDTAASAVRAHLDLVVLLTPVLAAAAVQLTWSMPSASWGWFCIAVAATYGAVSALALGRSRDLAAAHLLAFAVLLPLGTVAALSGDRLYVALAAEGALLLLLARRLGHDGARVVGHLLFLATVLWFAVRMDLAGIAGSWRAAADALVVALALTASTYGAAGREARVYRFAIHLAVLAWLWRELSILPGGAAYVSAAWAAYGLALLVAGLRWRIELLQRTALATLVLLVCKLFVVDLAALEALWRILLFLGVGGVFLLISYLLQGMWEERARIARR